MENRVQSEPRRHTYTMATQGEQCTTVNLDWQASSMLTKDSAMDGTDSIIYSVICNLYAYICHKQGTAHCTNPGTPPLPGRRRGGVAAWRRTMQAPRAGHSTRLPGRKKNKRRGKIPLSRTCFVGHVLSATIWWCTGRQRGIKICVPCLLIMRNTDSPSTSRTICQPATTRARTISYGR